MTFGSLFAGIGGFDLGFERAGMVCKWQVEINEFCRRVLAKHWPAVHRHDDVRTFPPKCGKCVDYFDRFQCGKPLECDCPNCQGMCRCEDWYVDVICGGFPCQDISVAGLGEGLAGARSGLWSEIVRVVRVVRPKYVVVENVAALLVRGVDTVLGDLAQVGYDAEWHCLPAAAVGAPHRRDRVFIVAYPNNVRLSQKADAEAPPKPVWGSKARIARDGWWDTEPGMGRVADGVPHRVDRIRGLGNSVVPQVAEWIGRRLMEIG